MTTARDLVIGCCAADAWASAEGAHLPPELERQDRQQLRDRAQAGHGSRCGQPRHRGQPRPLRAPSQAATTLPRSVLPRRGRSHRRSNGSRTRRPLRTSWSSVFTGMRPSKVAALRWSDVDLATQRVHVHRAIVQGQEKATTKTNTARMVLLNSRALAAVTRQRAATQLVGDFVFVDPRYGTPWLDERAFRRSYWTPALTALGLRYRKPSGRMPLK